MTFHPSTGRKQCSPFHFFKPVRWSLENRWPAKCVTEISASESGPHPSYGGPLEAVMPRNDPPVRSFFPPLFIPLSPETGRVVAAAAQLWPGVLSRNVAARVNFVSLSLFNSPLRPAHTLCRCFSIEAALVAQKLDQKDDFASKRFLCELSASRREFPIEIFGEKTR